MTIIHEELAQFFYPFLEDKLFPNEMNNPDFIRFSKAFYTQGTLHLQESQINYDYEVMSIDVTLCPLGMGL